MIYDLIMKYYDKKVKKYDKKVNILNVNTIFEVQN